MLVRFNGTYATFTPLEFDYHVVPYESEGASDDLGFIALI